MTFLRNIGADLVEKRLWPVAVALLVALVAVPMLLASSPSKPASDESAAVARAAADTENAVTLNTKPVGRRARGGSSKNPFKQLFVPKVEDVESGSAQAQAQGDDASKGGSPDSGGKTGGTPKSDDTGKPKPKAGSSIYRVTLRFGQPDNMRTIADIPRLTPLPSIESPFFVFLGVKDDGKTLVFLVSSDAKATGDGTCKPSASVCETIEMKAGDTEMFDLTTDDGVQQYQMDVVKVSKAKASSAKAARAARARHSKAGAALLTLAREDAEPTDMLGRYRWDAKRGVLRYVKPKASAAKLVGPIAGTASVTPAAVTPIAAVPALTPQP
jgi:hypothetical protein